MQPLRLFPQPSHTTRTSPIRHSKRVASTTSIEDSKESAGRQSDPAGKDLGKDARLGEGVLGLQAAMQVRMGQSCLGRWEDIGPASLPHLPQSCSAYGALPAALETA